MTPKEIMDAIWETRRNAEEATPILEAIDRLAAENAELLTLGENNDPMRRKMRGIIKRLVSQRDRLAAENEELRQSLELGAYRRIEMRMLAAEAELTALRQENAELRLYKRLHEHALACVDDVFQDYNGHEAMLPDFLALGECKFEGVKVLASAFIASQAHLETLREEARNQLAELAALRQERERLTSKQGAKEWKQ
jgi:hypothetical protein